MGFRATDYFDILSCGERKRRLCSRTAARMATGIDCEHHKLMENFSGRECATKAAEPFVHLERVSGSSQSPGF